MSNTPMVIRGITITLSPVNRFRSSNMVKYHVHLDEKPLGRRMQSNWQQCLDLRGRLDLHDMELFIEAIEMNIRAAGAPSREVGVVVRVAERRRFSQNITQEMAGRLENQLAKMLDHLTPTA